MSRRPVVCGILPPYILRNLAERGDAAARELARATLDASAYVRGERAVLASVPALLAVTPGEKRRTVYDAKQKTLLPGTRVRGEGEARSRDIAVNEAYDGSGKTFDFYLDVFDRVSIDGRGMRLDSTVHYGTRFANAQWNGRQMVYGDGDGQLFGRFTRSLDVIGHELTHGVTQCTAALAYHDEPGALNEHFSDVFGSLVKQHAKKQRADQADWLIGAELFTKRIHGVAVRSMKAPGTAYDDPLIGRDPQPAHMRDYVRGEEDNGGVHTNSGIPNHAFYQVAMALGGFAWEAAGQIWYRALTRKLHPEASFSDCAGATMEAATDLFGTASRARRGVETAWVAVGVIPERKRAAVPRKPVVEMPIAGAEMPMAVRRSTRS